MRRWLAYLGTAMLLISLTACGSKENSGTEEPPETAEPFVYSSFLAEASANEVRAKEACVGHSYEISAFVAEVAEEGCTLEILEPNASSDYSFFVSLDSESLTALNVDERITVVGTVADVSQGWIDVKPARLGDSSWELEGTVQGCIYASASDSVPAYYIVRVDGAVDTTQAPLCAVYLEDTSTVLEEGAQIRATGCLSRLSTNPLEGGVTEYHGEKVLLELKDAALTEQ